MFSEQELEILSVLEVSDYCFELAGEVGLRNAEWAVRDIVGRGQPIDGARGAVRTCIENEERRVRKLALTFKDTEEFWKAYHRGDGA